MYSMPCRTTLSERSRRTPAAWPEKAQQRRGAPPVPRGNPSLENFDCGPPGRGHDEKGIRL